MISTRLTNKGNAGTFFRLARKLVTIALNPKALSLHVAAKREALRQEELNTLWRDQDYILGHIASCTKSFYEANKGVTELEHQVGRYLNMRAICNEITASGLTGDVVEFGTWQGLGLILLGQSFSTDRTRRKLIGIDSYEGLPESSTIWRKGEFSNTSVESVRTNIARRVAGTDHLSVELIKGWFSDKSVRERLYATCTELTLVHFDADLASSTTQALALVTPYLVDRKKSVYFLFDDWGCHPDEVPDAFLSWLAAEGPALKLQAHKLSSTRFTRYYKITFDR